MKVGSNEWWSHFLTETDQFRKTTVFKNHLKSELNSLKESIFGLLLNMQHVPSFRFYVDGKLHYYNDSMIEKVRPHKTETFDEWADRCFRDNKVSLIINYCQSFSDEVAKVVNRLFEPIIELHGMPLGGFEITFLMGNYDYTPMGFHKDPIGHKVTHLHLGPGRKQMYLIEPDVWEKDLFAITGGRSGFRDFDKVLGYAQKFEIEAGDIFFMPDGKYHVGYSPEVSAAITIWHIDPSKAELQKKMIQLFQQRIFSKESDEVVGSNASSVNNVDYILESLGDTLNVDEEYEALGVNRILKTLVSDYELSLRSNSFMSNRAQHVGPLSKVLLTDTIQGNLPFEILSRPAAGSNRLVLYVRGNRMIVSGNPEVQNFINALNSGNKIPVTDAVHSLKSSWTEGDVLTFINELLKHKGISICSE